MPLPVLGIVLLDNPGHFFPVPGGLHILPSAMALVASVSNETYCRSPSVWGSENEVLTGLLRFLARPSASSSKILSRHFCNCSEYGCPGYFLSSRSRILFLGSKPVGSAQRGHEAFGLLIEILWHSEARPSSQ